LHTHELNNNLLKPTYLNGPKADKEMLICSLWAKGKGHAIQDISIFQVIDGQCKIDAVII